MGNCTCFERPRRKTKERELSAYSAKRRRNASHPICRDSTSIRLEQAHRLALALENPPLEDPLEGPLEDPEPLPVVAVDSCEL